MVYPNSDQYQRERSMTEMSEKELPDWTPEEIRGASAGAILQLIGVLVMAVGVLASYKFELTWPLAFIPVGFAIRQYGGFLAVATKGDARLKDLYRNVPSLGVFDFFWSPDFWFVPRVYQRRFGSEHPSETGKYK